MDLPWICNFDPAQHERHVHRPAHPSARLAILPIDPSSDRYLSLAPGDVDPDPRVLAPASTNSLTLHALAGPGTRRLTKTTLGFVRVDY